ncbi:hypothetical protein PALB_33920 [Pseudoalteromonas luteoviolacea B = ATCC 29581]|nr:hypothetical protein PALB_33920 [Pseudoalteromonas luteoviolacea B = ATCC 29581]
MQLKTLTLKKLSILCYFSAIFGCLLVFCDQAPHILFVPLLFLPGWLWKR